MTHAPNQLSEDFEPYAGKIASLIISDDNFARMMTAYEDLNDSIYKAEQLIEPASDLHLEGLKKRRLALKDQIMARLTA
ncbi:MAG TPA: DUF465 domain-containing protein [Rhizobiales bacterium]|nr:DUF465 domain-containing protein [Hyphomicrobiales bacterium]